MIRPICHCERRKVRGNPLFLFRVLRILSRFALRMTSRLVITTTVKCAINCRPVIAVRVSGGHLCKAEAPTEPAGETAVRRVAIRFPCSPSLRRCGCPVDTFAKQKHRPSRQARCVNGCGNPFFLFRVLRILSRFALRMTNCLVIANAVRRAAIRFPCSPVIAKPCKRLWQSVLPFYKAITSKNIADL